jgi:hypothetical protein
MSVFSIKRRSCAARFTKKSHPGAAGEVGLDRTASILFQNGFFGKFGRPFGPGRWLDIPRRG